METVFNACCDAGGESPTDHQSTVEEYDRLNWQQDQAVAITEATARCTEECCKLQYQIGVLQRDKDRDAEVMISLKQASIM